MTAVRSFPTYVGSILSSSGRFEVDVEKRVAQASKAFGALREAVFLDRNLSLATKRVLYNAGVLSVVLSAGPLSGNMLGSSELLHHTCIRAILGISNRQR